MGFHASHDTREKKKVPMADTTIILLGIGHRLDDVRVTSIGDADGGHAEVLTAGRAEVNVV